MATGAWSSSGREDVMNGGKIIIASGKTNVNAREGQLRKDVRSRGHQGLKTCLIFTQAKLMD